MSVAFAADQFFGSLARAQWAFGQEQMVMRAGMHAVVVPTRRPPVNPWRHAYVRAKHFRHAAARADCIAIDVEWCQGEGWPPRESSVRLHDRAHTWNLAADNAEWGGH